MRAVSWMALSILAACDATPRSSPPVVSLPPRVASSATASSLPAPLQPPRLPLHEVVVSFLGDDGAYHGAAFLPEPDAASAVGPCYERALAETPSLQGWIAMDFDLTQDGPARVGSAESSGLPDALVSCVTGAMKRLTRRPEGPWLHARAYVSLRRLREAAPGPPETTR
jgi:hypothetical protein